MEIKNFMYENRNKMNLASKECQKIKEFNKEYEVSVELYGSKFNLSCPWHNGGSIDSNCKVLFNKDLNIISEFNIKKLQDLYEDLDYLKELINKRISDIKEKKNVIKYMTSEFKEGNKKFYNISIIKYDMLIDSYNDSKIINKEVIESYKISNTKSNKKEIKSIINELNKKYNIDIK